jgi:hypothetical protein
MKLETIIQKINESTDMKVKFQLISEIYEILTNEFPEIKAEYTESAFFLSYK